MSKIPIPNKHLDIEAADRLIPPAAGFWRRLLAISYDLLLLAAVLMIATLPVVLINKTPPQSFFGVSLFRLYLLAVSFLFMGWSWVHGGQTLGMRAWKTRVVLDNGHTLQWHHAAWRFSLALASWLCLGLGFLWMLMDKNLLTTYDRWSKTRVIVLPQKK